MTSFPTRSGAECGSSSRDLAQEQLQSVNEEALKLERTLADAELVRQVSGASSHHQGDAAACGFRELEQCQRLRMEDAPGARIRILSRQQSGGDRVRRRRPPSAPCWPLRRKGKRPRRALAKMIRELGAAAKGKSARRRRSKADVAPAAWTDHPGGGGGGGEGKKGGGGS